ARQGRGHEPDRVVQGPRHGLGHVEGVGRRRDRRCVRLDRKHQRLGRGLRHGGGPDLRRAAAAGEDRGRQARPGGGPRSEADPGRRQLRRLPRDRPQLDAAHPIELVNSVNPYRLQGQKTAAFEVSDALGAAPDLHVLPVGNADTISAYWMGYREYRAAGATDSLPRMWGFQAAGAAPFVAGHPITDPETVATAIRIGAPASWHLAVEARDDSGGLI